MIPEYIIIHDSDSPYGNSFVVDCWHKDRHFHYLHQNSGTDIHVGYQYLILNGYLYSTDEYDKRSDGQIIACRPENVIGAHCRDNGMNRKSIGICVIGPFKAGPGQFSAPQINGLIKLCSELMTEHSIPINHVLGHKEVTTKKRDPRFDMGHFRAVLKETK